MSKKQGCAPNIFREYDLRGLVESEIPLDQTGDLTRAILTYFLQKQPNLSKIVVGMDGRTHSPEIKKHVIDAAHDLGIDVVDIGLVPTPVFYFSLFTTDATSGLMITASHNPKEYNGIKICLDTKSVWGTQIQEIKEIYESGEFLQNGPGGGVVGEYDALSSYITWTKEHFPHLQNHPINAVIDCGNATAGTVFPRLIEAMGWTNVKLLFEDVDGTFPNHEADPTKYKNMQDVKTVLDNDASIIVGLGLDGDSDRMNPMTKSGYLVPGDQLLALYTQKIIKKFPKAPIVFDIKSSGALIQALESYGATPCIAPSGHSIIKEHLRKHDAKLAGELSCHFFFNDRYFGYDDGIYAALRLFELLEESDESFDEMIAKLPQKTNSPEYRIKCAQDTLHTIVDHVKTVFAARKDTSMLTIDGVRAQMPYGWGLLRASNTQPVICLRFEADNQDDLQRVQDDFVNALAPYFSKDELKEHLEK